ncbi:hypothetical protein CENSYa_0878 [Cenarchaeum symbiosum A]|uniref:Uncharacterized protein n=1 Tax=Cenarchaeum symbiosum (strain A) TaxID=414004 RepID=A0RVZ3_CENSY|nr:hypothetical protein CENSYa_0878 [Cenarchaeum symbiosum A]
MDQGQDMRRLIDSPPAALWRARPVWLFIRVIKGLFWAIATMKGKGQGTAAIRYSTRSDRGADPRPGEYP